MKKTRHAMSKLIAWQFLLVTAVVLFSDVIAAGVKNEQEALSALCKKLMYKHCNPERDKQLKKYFGEYDIQALGEKLHEYSGQAPAFVSLPKDRAGFVDWGSAVSENIIQPRGSLTGGDSEYEKYYENIIVLKTKIDVVPDVIFPHGVHTYWLSCASCHPSPFKKKKGQNNFSMADIIGGKQCGKCHGKVAFAPQTFKNCSRCHALKKTSDIPPWGNF